MLTATVQPRIDDLGPAGHVHNTVLPAWFQEARYELLSVFFDPQNGDAFPLVIKEYTVTFHRELVLFPEVYVEIQVERVGNSSFTLREHAYQNEELAAESKTLYIYLGADHRPGTIPEQQQTFLNQHLVADATE